MRRTHLFILTLAASLLAAAGCGNPQTSSNTIDKSVKSAAENVEDAASDAAYAVGEAAADLEDAVQQTAEEVGKAIDNRGRPKSNAK